MGTKNPIGASGLSAALWVALVPAVAVAVAIELVGASSVGESLNPPASIAPTAVIATVREHVPEAEPGLAYGMPAFRYRGRPLIGFSSNRFGLNIYPFDPRIVPALASELRDYELGKGVVRFTADKPIS